MFLIAGVATEESKYSGLEDLDVGSKFKMFEAGGSDELRAPASDRYGIMEKLKRLQEGEDMDDLLAEIDEELPDVIDEDADEMEELGLTAVQKRVKALDAYLGQKQTISSFQNC